MACKVVWVYDGIPRSSVMNNDLCRTLSIAHCRKKFGLVVHKGLVKTFGIAPGFLTVLPSIMRSGALRIIIPNARLSFRAHF